MGRGELADQRGGPQQGHEVPGMDHPYFALSEAQDLNPAICIPLWAGKGYLVSIKMSVLEQAAGFSLAPAGKPWPWPALAP